MMNPKATQNNRDFPLEINWAPLYKGALISAVAVAALIGGACAFHFTAPHQAAAFRQFAHRHPVVLVDTALMLTLAPLVTLALHRKSHRSSITALALISLSVMALLTTLHFKAPSTLSQAHRFCHRHYETIGSAAFLTLFTLLPLTSSIAIIRNMRKEDEEDRILEAICNEQGESAAIVASKWSSARKARFEEKLLRKIDSLQEEPHTIRMHAVSCGWQIDH